MKFFKETMGMSFVQYLNDYRLEVAAKLLTTTSDDIINIAINTGFDNLSYFNRCFKKKYGITPGKYRKDARD
jgi:AraC-like DNA-binding protein